jgi:hypothetical protein
MKKEHIILASLGVAALGAFLLLNKKNEDVVEEQAEPTSQPVYVKLDKDLILKRGMQGYEVKELQRLLGLSKSDQDGVFGGGTETALLNKKGVKSITLNQFPTKTNVASTALKVGDIVQPKNITGADGYENKLSNGNYINTGKYLDTWLYKEDIGKIIAFAPDKINVVVKATHFFGDDEIVWFKTAELEKA